MPHRPLNYGRQCVDEDDVAAVVRVLESDFLTQGPTVERFEDAIAERVGVKHAVAFANATAALHGAAAACEIGPGDVGVTQAITFCASANMFLYCGGEAAFCDVDEQTLNCDPASLAATIERIEADGRKVKAVTPVHMGGLSVKEREIRDAAGSRLVIEDASHALGATYEDGKPIGSCAHADIAVFSFHPVKPITTGEGGIATTNDPALAKRLRMFRNHGIEKAAASFQAAQGDEADGDGPWYYEQQTLGYNYRLSDLHAALGLSQLGKLDDFTARRRHLAERYDAAFAGSEAVRPLQADPSWRARSAHHLYTVAVNFETSGTDRRAVMNTLRASGIGTQVHYIPVYRHPYYRARYGLRFEDFPQAERYYASALTLPLHPGMAEEDVDRVVTALSDALAADNRDRQIGGKPQPAGV